MEIIEPKKANKPQSSIISMTFGIIGFVFTVAIIFTIIFINYHMKQYALSEAKEKVRIILDRNFATHTYFSQKLKPAVFQLVDPILDKAYFEPAWMSSTYAVREIDKYFQDISPTHYYYKECAINARSPENEADDFERDFLKKINANPNITISSEIIELNNSPYYVVLRQAEKMDKSCLRCHGNPETAPKNLVDIYGDKRSFHRELGEIVSAVSIRIPLATAYSEANRISLLLSVIFSGLLIVLYAINYFVSQRFVFGPISRLQIKTQMIANGEEPIGTQIILPKGRELSGLAQAFNQMSLYLRDHFDNLDNTVKKRTQELIQLNENLNKEIESHKKTDQFLQENQAILKAAMDYSHAGIAIADAPDGKLRYVNEAGLGIRGKKREEIVNGINIDQYVSSWQILHFDGTPYKAEDVPLARAILYGEVCSEEFLIRRPNQEDRIVLANAAPIKNDQGQIIAGIVIFLDITESKRAALVLEREKYLNQLRLEIINEITTNPELDEMMICDIVLEKMIGLAESPIGFLGFMSPDEKTMRIHACSSSVMAICAVKNKPLEFPIDDAGIWAEAIKKRKPIFYNDAKYFESSINGMPEGHIKINRLMVIPVLDANKIVAVAAVANKSNPYDEIDIKHFNSLLIRWWEQLTRKRFLKEKIKVDAQLQQIQKMESIGTLAGGIAHDFNNLLGVITGNVSYSLAKLNRDDELFEVLSEVQDGAKQAQTLTQQLLTFAKGGEPVKKTININQLIKESAQFVVRGSNSRCEYKLSEKVSLVEVDTGQINQVISNLVINANQAMPDGGIIYIKTENIELEPENTLALSAGEYIKITVEDQGVGISKKQLPNIFDPFFTTKQKGNGLGLSTAYSIIKRHGGQITVYSEVEKGTVFNIYLPASLKEVKKNEGKEDSDHQGKGNILIMDDQEAILKMVGRMLNGMGYKTAFATDGSQAVDMYKEALTSENSFDLVILDLTVPGGMGGLKTIIELSKIDPDVKAVVSSGYSNDPVMSNHKNYGFSGIMPKPYTKAQLTEVLNKVLGRLKSDH
ncbi:MAG: DUF3365 domain-containing protein [Desulfamplus sp.]|nr:DUF3365 domain-containing protein [Desulfamplus sp.]